MSVEWKPNTLTQDDPREHGEPDFIAIEGEPPPHRELLNNALEIKRRLDEEREAARYGR